MAAEKPIPIAEYLPKDPPGPPAELGVAGSNLWRNILEEWDLDGYAALAVLLEACFARDANACAGRSLSRATWSRPATAAPRPTV
jgi:hypothetical protein